MASNNYAEFGQRFSLEGTFRVLRMTALHPEPLDYDEVHECGISTTSSDLKALIANAKSLRFADFGNGLAGICGEGDDSLFCAVSDHKQPTTEHKGEFQSENPDKKEEDIV